MLHLHHFPLILRRFVAFCYDGLLIFSILFIVGAIAIAINGGEAVNPNYFLPVCMVVIFFFYGWFWTHGGQTLGMQAWKLKLISNHGRTLNWKQSIIRTALMLLLSVVGILWILVNENGQSIQDLFSGTTMNKTE